MKAIDQEEAREAGADPVGRAEVAVMPPSNAAAAKKGGWQAAGGVLAAVITLVTALWFEPTIAAVVAKAMMEHPEWAVYFAVLNAVFGFLKNRISHREPESRLAIVGEPKVGTRADRRG